MVHPQQAGEHIGVSYIMKSESNYAHHNDAYKKMRTLAISLNAPDDKSLFELGGTTASNSQLQSWRVGRGHKNFRPISENQLLAFIDGLIKWVESND